MCTHAHADTYILCVLKCWRKNNEVPWPRSPQKGISCCHLPAESREIRGDRLNKTVARDNSKESPLKEWEWGVPVWCSCDAPHVHPWMFWKCFRRKSVRQDSSSTDTPFSPNEPGTLFVRLWDLWKCLNRHLLPCLWQGWTNRCWPPGTEGTWRVGIPRWLGGHTVLNEGEAGLSACCSYFVPQRNSLPRYLRNLTHQNHSPGREEDAGQVFWNIPASMCKLSETLAHKQKLRTTCGI